MRRGLDQLRGVADNIDIDGEVIDQDEYIASAENQVKAAIAEWHLVTVAFAQISACVCVTAASPIWPAAAN